MQRPDLRPRWGCRQASNPTLDPRFQDQAFADQQEPLQTRITQDLLNYREITILSNLTKSTIAPASFSYFFSKTYEWLSSCIKWCRTPEKILAAAKPVVRTSGMYDLQD